MKIQSKICGKIPTVDKFTEVYLIIWCSAHSRSRYLAVTALNRLMLCVRCAELQSGLKAIAIYQVLGLKPVARIALGKPLSLILYPLSFF